MSSTDHRFNAALQAAAHRIKRTAATTAERTLQALGTAAVSATSGGSRDAYLGVQFDFERGLARFNQRFAEVLDEKIAADRMRMGAARTLDLHRRAAEERPGRARRQPAAARDHRQGAVARHRGSHPRTRAARAAGA